MKNIQISKSEFIVKALEFCRQVATSGISLIVTDHGKPLIEVRPYHLNEHSPFRSIRRKCCAIY